MQAYLTWVGSRASKYWSSYGSNGLGENGDYYFSIEALYVGSIDDADPDDYNSFVNNLATVHGEKIVYFHEDIFDTFYDKLVVQAPESIDIVNKMETQVSVLLNESATIDPSLTKDLTDMWLPRCYRCCLNQRVLSTKIFSSEME